MTGIPLLILSVGSIIAVLFFVTYASQKHDLNGIKDKTVGNGQHGTARWATRQEVKRTYHHVPFTPEEWRQAAKNGNQPTANGKPFLRVLCWVARVAGKPQHWWILMMSMC